MKKCPSEYYLEFESKIVQKVVFQNLNILKTLFYTHSVRKFGKNLGKLKFIERGIFESCNCLILRKNLNFRGMVFFHIWSFNGIYKIMENGWFMLCRAWPQINWILVRLWKGCGFGYRYAFPPHMSPIRLRHCTQDYDSASFQRPCPSPVFQQHVAEQLTQDDDTMQQFINRFATNIDF